MQNQMGFLQICGTIQLQHSVQASKAARFRPLWRTIAANRPTTGRMTAVPYPGSLLAALSAAIY
jgi:hypothetical protein